MKTDTKAAPTPRKLRKHLQFALGFTRPRVLEAILEKLCDGRVPLSDSDLEHLMCLHRRLHRKTVRKMLKAFDAMTAAETKAAEPTRPALRLIVDNTRK